MGDFQPGRFKDGELLTFPVIPPLAGEVEVGVAPYLAARSAEESRVWVGYTVYFEMPGFTLVGTDPDQGTVSAKGARCATEAEAAAWREARWAGE